RQARAPRALVFAAHTREAAGPPAPPRGPAARPARARIHVRVHRARAGPSARRGAVPSGRPRVAPPPPLRAARPRAELLRARRAPEKCPGAAGDERVGSRVWLAGDGRSRPAAGTRPMQSRRRDILFVPSLVTRDEPPKARRRWPVLSQQAARQAA